MNANTTNNNKKSNNKSELKQSNTLGELSNLAQLNEKPKPQQQQQEPVEILNHKNRQQIFTNDNSNMNNNKIN
jgi:hypothetical protein